MAITGPCLLLVPYIFFLLYMCFPDLHLYLRRDDD